MLFSILFSALCYITLATELHLVKVSFPNPSTAKCIDGTPPAYFYREGFGSGAKKWYIFHEGGAWCFSLEECYQRSLIYSGSSNPYPPTIELNYSYFSSDRLVNPLFYNWNIAYLKYCDGGSFSGNNLTVSYWNGSPLYFRGFHNLRAIRNSLYRDHGLGQATDVVVSGCSAGGLTTYMQLDWWAENLPRGAKVRGLSDSGFFPEYNSDIEGEWRFADKMRWVFNQMNSTSDAGCLRHNRQDKAKCIFAEHIAPFINTPIFAAQAIYDKFQTDFMLGATDWFTGDINNTDAVNEYGDYFVGLVSNSVLRSPRNGAFLDSCHHHCYDSLTTIHVNGANLAQAFSRWYSPYVSVETDPFPCSYCCSVK